MTGRGRRVAPIGVRPATCPLCLGPLPFHVRSCPSLPAYSIEKAAARLGIELAEWQRETLRRLLRDGGSSLTVRGARDSRTWSVTGSSGSVSRRLRHAKSGNGSQRTRSTSGTASTKTPGSWKSSTVVDDITGTVEVTLVEYGVPNWGMLNYAHHEGPLHDAYCPVCKHKEAP